MFRVLVFFVDNEKQIDDMGNEIFKYGYIFKDVESEEEADELFNESNKALIEKVNKHIESYGEVEVFKGSQKDFESEQEVSIRTMRYCNTCSEQIEADSMKGDMDVWKETEIKGYRSKLAGVKGMVNEIQLM